MTPLVVAALSAILFACCAHTQATPCVHGSFRPHPTDCRVYYVCTHDVLQLMSCPAGLHFNPTLDVCDYAAAANCSVVHTTTTITTEEATKTTTTDATTPETTWTTESTTATTPEATTVAATTENIWTTAATSATDIPDDSNRCRRDCALIESTWLGVALPHPNCQMFYTCSEGLPVERQCYGNFRFSVLYNGCVSPAMSECKDREAPVQC